MKTKIIGITLAVIMLASVFAAIAPVSAAPAQREGNPEDAVFDVIYQGEKVMFTTGIETAYDVIFYEIEDTNKIFRFSATPNTAKTVSADIAPEGSYKMSYVKTGEAPTRTEKDVTIIAPKVVTKITDAAGEDIESTTKGTQLKMSTSSLALPTDDVVKVRRLDPKGNEELLGTVTVGNLGTFLIDTTNWDVGDHQLWISTIKEQSYGLDKASDKDTIAIYKQEIKIEAETEEPAEQEHVKFTVRAPPNTAFDFETNHPENVMMTNKEKDPLGLGAGATPVAMDTVGGTFAATTNEDGEYKFVVYFTDDGTFTFKVWFGGALTYDGATTDERNKLEIDVTKIKIVFDMPKSAVIGEDVDIKGTVPAGDNVDIYVEGKQVANDEPITGGEFDFEWETDKETSGTKKITVYVDCDQNLAKEDDLNNIAAWNDEDGATSIRLVIPGIEASQPRSIVAKDDDWTVEGTATGTSMVDVIVVGPDGFTGDSGTGFDLEEGLDWTTPSVSDDNTFDDDMSIPEDAQTGRYIATVLSPGRDGKYGTTDATAGNLNLALVEEYIGATGTQAQLLDWLSGRNQQQVISLLTAATTEKAGSDDLVVVLTFSVESGYIKFDPVASVAAGEPLNVTGVTNREPETSVTITSIAGPDELPPAIVEVEWESATEGKFAASLDTEGVPEGTYTLEVDDGDGNTDTTTVTIGAAAPATPAPTAAATPAPTAAATAPPPATPTAAPAATPTAAPEETPEEPGFGAMFAIAGLLAVAYLVLRIKK